MLCDYGCGQEAKHQFKNGKWCCSNHYSKCPKIRDNISNKMKGKNHPNYGKKRPNHSKQMMGEKNPMYGKTRNHIEKTKKKISEAIKGKNHPNYGKKRSEETKIKIGKYHKGKTLSKKHRNIISQLHKDKKKSVDHRRKISESRKGIKFSKETKISMSENHADVSGENNPNWKGGISCDSYCQVWSDKEYKESIKERDGYNCLNPLCNHISKKLCLHHIDYNKKNCHPNNLITICLSCNSKANTNRKWHTEWYKRILNRRYNI